jgi:hypothetical protein
MPERATICFYVSGHGFGHAIRTIQTLRALPSDIRIIVKSAVPESLFTEELPGRTIEVIAGEYDCGCVQRDSLTILPRETLDRYRAIVRQNEGRLSEEVAFLQNENVTVVVSDVASFPLRAAREAGLPGVIIANFTWADIYRPYVETEEDARLVDALAVEYALAYRAFITPLSVPTITDLFSRITRIPLIARRGRPIRDTLINVLNRPLDTHFALFYLGAWGFDIDWQALAHLTYWTFLTYETPPVELPNVIALSRRKWVYADVAASVDVVISKPGYGTVTECIANNVPFVYVPRPGFAENDALVDGMARWGGGFPIASAQFQAGDWGPVLQAALAARPDSTVYTTDGAQVAAETLIGYCHR